MTLLLHPSMELDAQHAFLAASHSVRYSFERIKGLANVLHGGSGMYLDRFVTAGEPGIVLLHGYGNVFERTLGAGEKILVDQAATCTRTRASRCRRSSLMYVPASCATGCTWPR